MKIALTYMKRMKSMEVMLLGEKDDKGQFSIVSFFLFLCQTSTDEKSKIIKSVSMVTEKNVVSETMKNIERTIITRHRTYRLDPLIFSCITELHASMIE